MNYLYGACLLVGIILFFLAFYFYKKTEALLQSGIKVKAEVTDNIRVSDNDGDTYKSVFTYQHNTEGEKKFITPISSRPAAYEVGEIATIVYNPKVYDDVKVVSFWGLYRWSILLLLFASPLLIIGGSYLIYTKFRG